MVANRRVRTECLNRLIEAACGMPLGQRPWDVSGPKGDGTVFIRFRSSPTVAAITFAERFRDVLNAQGYEFEQTDDHKFRFPLGQF